MALICELPLIANPMRECCFHWKPAQICKPHNSRSALPQKQLASMIAKAIQKPPFLGTQKWSGHLMGVFVYVFGCRLPAAKLLFVNIWTSDNCNSSANLQLNQNNCNVWARPPISSSKNESKRRFLPLTRNWINYKIMHKITPRTHQFMQNYTKQ